MPTFNIPTTLVFLIKLSLLSLTAHSNYLFHYCNESNETSTYPPNSISYHSNLKSLLILLSDATRDNGFYSDTVGGDTPNVAHGLFLCRGDVDSDVCQKCVVSASREILDRCPSEGEAVIWYDQCMLRYANWNFFSIMAEGPLVCMTDQKDITDQDSFDELLANTMNDLAKGAVNDQTAGKKFATREVNLTSGLQTLYSLTQCTPDLTKADCSRCLTTRAFPFISNCYRGKQGGRLLLPSCNVRFEVYPFYGVTPTASPPPASTLLPLPAPSNIIGEKGTKAVPIAVGTSASATFLVVALLGSCIFYIWRTKGADKEDKKNSQEIQLLDFEGGRSLADDYSNENLQGEKKQGEFPLIRLNLINAATNNFSDENKLGEGGFGPVYKGTLLDGKEIAVKRLSRNSGQGLQEFKNEVTLIARLQHRNLVRLLGSCLEGNELLLIYEYMPNKSLDVLLFDSTEGAQLDWKRRLGIINGIARGLLYLHEDSRLKIIHRDLKASNVLLDHEMNPKISDFGMARIFGGNQSEANTNRVVGTYGYMAPEYAMEGLFSVKSDVYSFGVLLLEIISGKKNRSFYSSSEYSPSLLTFAWKLWLKGQGLELMDPLLVQSYETVEVLKCIHIGLLCVQEDPTNRPTMSSVVVMLSSDTVTLPQPTQPAFSVGRVVRSAELITPNNIVCSVNDLTLSIVSPR